MYLLKKILICFYLKPTQGYKRTSLDFGDKIGHVLGSVLFSLLNMSIILSLTGDTLVARVNPIGLAILVVLILILFAAQYALILWLVRGIKGYRIERQSGGMEHHPYLDKVEIYIDKLIKNILFSLSKLCERILFIFAILVLVAGAVSGVGYLLYQIYTYLKSGVWVSFSLNNLVEKFGGSLELWANNPEEWSGLHKIFEQIPLSIFLLAFGVWFGIFLLNKHSDYRNRINRGVNESK